MDSTDFSELIDHVRQRQAMVKAYLFDENRRIRFTFQHLEDAVYSYLNAGGKSLRAAVMMFCCGAVGGDEKTAIPAASAIELYHTFTLVHDDIIDRDEMRRGVPTIHYDFAQRAVNEMGFDKDAAEHYGLTLAILAGDLQQGWAASILPDLYYEYGIPPELPLALISQLFRRTQIDLINGETLDVIQSETPVEYITEKQVLDMLWQKTGVLYEFAGQAGSAIGLRLRNLHHPTVKALGEFTGRCGIAFQIQDDVLGIIGDEQQLGKPIGSDIREGKRTIIVLHSLQKMSQAQRQFTLKILGNADASHDDISEVSAILNASGGIDYAKQLAQKKVEEALSYLDVLDDSHYKKLLRSWAKYIVERQL